VSGEIERANAVLHKGARGMLATGVASLLLLVTLAAFRLAQSDSRPVSPTFWILFGGLALWSVIATRARYREIIRLRLSEEGVELREETSGWTLVPWAAVQQIEFSRVGFRIHAAGRKPFSTNLMFAGDLGSIRGVFERKRPGAVRSKA